MTVIHADEIPADLARFQRDTATHRMTVLHDNGLYRHLRFRSHHLCNDAKFRPTSSAYWFDLVTWPGCLAINGDCGSFLFSRQQDMFDFFRSRYGINPQYWAEKVQAGQTAAYSQDKFRQHVAEEAKDCEGDYPGLTAAIEARIFGDLREWDTGYEDGAREALRDFTYLPAGAKGEPFTFADAWEWDLRDYDWQFLWCCHAIRWGIRQYDREQAERNTRA
jgi:hypothetical protein